MTDRELQKLRRGDLLELLIAQKKENDRLAEQLEEALKKLESRELKLQTAGSIAEAALQMNGVFAAAEAAAAQYLENIQALNERQSALCREMEEKSRQEAARLMEETQAKCRQLEEETRAKCEVMTETARAQSQQYWDNVQSQLQAFLDAHSGLRQLLNTPGPQNT